MKNIVILILSLVIFSCQQGNTDSPQITTSPDPALEGFEITDIPGTNYQKAVKKDEAGTVLEEGQLINGQRTGTWITYHGGQPFPKSLITYTGGLANGPYFEFNNRGQVEMKASYLNNKLDGPWATYKFGRPMNTANYKNGELDGIYVEYATGTGKPKKEIGYKEGKMHGRYIYFDEEGNVTLEYMYKNGEKVE